MKSRSLVGALALLWLAACSQPPAPVAHKGNEFFGKEKSLASIKSGKSRTKAKVIKAQPDMPFIPEESPVIEAKAAPVAELEVAELGEADVKPERKKKSEKAFKSARFTPEAPRKTGKRAQPVEQLAALPIAGKDADANSAGAVQAAAFTQMQGRKKPQMASLNDRVSNFIWPVEGAIVSRFGRKSNGLINEGINISAREGEPIWAASAGEVAYAGNQLKGYGNMIILRHANGWMSAYAHASDMLVRKGDQVSQGDLIGYVGKSGAVEQAQLHFGIRKGQKPVDPESLLPRKMASAQ